MSNKEDLNEIWGLVSECNRIDTYASNPEVEAIFVELEFDAVFSRYSQCVRLRRASYKLCQVFESEFNQLVPQPTTCEKKSTVKKVKEKRKQTSQKLKTLRMKRLKLLEDNIDVIRNDGESSATYKCKHCSYISRRRQKAFHQSCSSIQLKLKEKKKRRRNKVKIIIQSVVKKKYFCSDLFCNKKFTSRYARKRHILSVHVYCVSAEIPV